MDSTSLENLGFVVHHSPRGPEVALEISTVELINPLTKTPINRVVLLVKKETLEVTEPPELVGVSPIQLAHLQSPVDVEHQLLNGFNEGIFHLRKRSAELQTIGLNPLIQPQNLELMAEVQAGNFRFVIAANRRGEFALSAAQKDGRDLVLQGGLSFDLSEFRHRDALAGYLSALAGDFTPVGPAPTPEAIPPTVPTKPPGSLTVASLGELASRFGPAAIVPPKSTLEILAEIEVRGARYRFAAARVAGRTFRGLLAGSRGKVWSDRFELDTFPGVAALASEVLQTPIAEVKLLDATKGS